MRSHERYFTLQSTSTDMQSVVRKILLLRARIIKGRDGNHVWIISKVRAIRAT